MRLFTFVLVLFFVVFSLGCDKKEYDIDGTWQRFDTVWTFENGNAYINGSRYDFYTSGTELFLKKDGTYISFPYNITEGTLNINGSEFHRLKAHTRSK